MQVFFLFCFAFFFKLGREEQDDHGVLLQDFTQRMAVGFKPTTFRWPYCLTIIGCNFVSNDLLHQTLISYNGPWFTFPFMHIDDIIRF